MFGISTGSVLRFACDVAVLWTAGDSVLQCVRVRAHSRNHHVSTSNSGKNVGPSCLLVGQLGDAQTVARIVWYSPSGRCFICPSVVCSSAHKSYSFHNIVPSLRSHPITTRSGCGRDLKRDSLHMPVPSPHFGLARPVGETFWLYLRVTTVYSGRSIVVATSWKRLSSDDKALWQVYLCNGEARQFMRERWWDDALKTLELS